eukprot:1560293-Rhodomonas_salina.2
MSGTDVPGTEKGYCGTVPGTGRDILVPCMVLRRVFAVPCMVLSWCPVLRRDIVVLRRDIVVPGELSNFDYLMQLNQLAGRSMSDLSRYLGPTSRTLDPRP